MHVSVTLGQWQLLKSMKHSNSRLLRATNRRGWTPLHLAVARGDDQIVKLLWEQTEELPGGLTLLHIAAANGNEKAAKFLVKKGVKKRATYKGCTASQVAAVMGEEHLAMVLGLQWWQQSLCQLTPEVPDIPVDEFEELTLYSVRCRWLDSTDVVRKQKLNPRLANYGSLTSSQERLMTQNSYPLDLQDTDSRHCSDPAGFSQWNETRERRGERDSAGGQLDKRKREYDNRDEQLKRTKKEKKDEENEVKEILKHEAEETKEKTNMRLGEETPHGTTETIVSQREERRDEPVELSWGLPNLGNTCYMNSVLQCLLHVQPLASRLRELKLKSDCRQGEVVRAVLGVMSDMESGTSKKGSVTQLRRVAGKRDSVYNDGHQKDAHDFLSQLLDWLHEETAAPPLSQNGVGRNGDDNRESIISVLFHGTHLSTITCPMNFSRPLCVNHETFSNLSLAVSQPTDTSLQVLLQHYYQEQQLQWDCNHCQDEHECKHKVIICHLPHILLLHLNRATDPTKSAPKTRVSYPEHNLVIQHTMEANRRRYSLFAVCCHKGKMFSGHYIAYCKSGERWYYFNDNFVNYVSLNDVLDNPTAHILFYMASESQR